jgi:hypothetical protein
MDRTVSVGTTAIPLEQLFPLRQAARKIPGRRPGKSISRSALERWRTKGVRGVVLRTVKVGTTVCTCDAWIAEFLELLNSDKPASQAPETRTPTQRERAAAEARKTLKAAWGK